MVIENEFPYEKRIYHGSTLKKTSFQKGIGEAGSYKNVQTKQWLL